MTNSDDAYNKGEIKIKIKTSYSPQETSIVGKITTLSL